MEFCRGRMELEVVNEWARSAEGCFARGDMNSMRACGRQLLEEVPESPEGLALVAEASVYLQDFETAEEYLQKFWELPSQKSVSAANLRGLLAAAVFFGARYELDRALSAYEQLFSRYQDGIKKGLSSRHRFISGQKGWSELVRQLVMRGYSFYADTCLLAGETEKAAEAAFMVSSMLEDRAAAILPGLMPMTPVMVLT